MDSDNTRASIYQRALGREGVSLCPACDGPGLYHCKLEDPLPLMLATPSGRVLHARCMSPQLLLKCGTYELVFVRAVDVGPELFLQVVEELERRRAAEPV